MELPSCTGASGLIAKRAKTALFPRTCVASSRRDDLVLIIIFLSHVSPLSVDFSDILNCDLLYFNECLVRGIDNCFCG